MGPRRVAPLALFSFIGFLFLLLFSPSESSAQSTRVYVPTPTPTPSARVRYGGGVAPSFANVPAHSPDRLDFEPVFDGDTSVRTLSLTSNGKGFLNAEVRSAAFHIVEYRELGLPIRSPDGRRTTPSVKTRIPYGAHDSRALGWDTQPGTEIQIDVAFNPRFDLVSMGAGDKTAALALSGPGPYGAWQLAISLHGLFHGLRLKPTLLVKDREPVLVRPADALDVAVDVLSPATPVSGTIRGVAVPAGVSVDSAAVSAPAGQAFPTKVRVHASPAVPADGAAREVGLELAGSGATAGFALVVVPAVVRIDRMVPTCSLRDAYVALSAFPDHLELFLQGASGDVTRDRIARFSVTLGGRELMWANLHLKPAGIGPVRPVKATFDTRRLPIDFESFYSSGEYPALVRGPLTFSCRVD